MLNFLTLFQLSSPHTHAHTLQAWKEFELNQAPRKGKDLGEEKCAEGSDKPFLYSLELIVSLDTLAWGIVKFWQANLSLWFQWNVHKALVIFSDNQCQCLFQSNPIIWLRVSAVALWGELKVGSGSRLQLGQCGVWDRRTEGRLGGAGLDEREGRPWENTEKWLQCCIWNKKSSRLASLICAPQWQDLIDFD